MIIWRVIISQDVFELPGRKINECIGLIVSNGPVDPKQP